MIFKPNPRYPRWQSPGQPRDSHAHQHLTDDSQHLFRRPARAPLTFHVRTDLQKHRRRPLIVIKNTFLSNTDNASVSLRRKLLEECNLHTVLDCPGGTFIGAGVKTVVLFFEKGAKTRKVWFYQLDPGRNLGKTNPLNDADLAEFIALQKTKADSPKSWSVDVAAIDSKTFDLSVKNPNGGEAIAHRSPQEIMDEIAALDAESAEVLANIKALL